MAKTNTKKNKGSRRHRKPSSGKSTDFSRNYSLYIRRVLKEVDPQKSISSHTVGIMNTMINNIFEHISTQACNLMCFRNRCTLTHEDIQKAMYMLFPGKRSKYAVTFGSEAVQRYVHSKNNVPR